MFSVIRRQLPRTLVRSVLNNSSNKTFSNVCHSHLPLVSRIVAPCHHEILRYKSKKKGEKKPVASESVTEEESAAEDEVEDKHAKTMQLTVKSPRIDVILKSSLGIARNKIETLFYESKIRVNGKKMLKKSDLAQEGDEIDVVKSASDSNPNFLTVARVEVLEIKEKGENLSVKVRRCKSLTVEKYVDEASS